MRLTVELYTQREKDPSSNMYTHTRRMYIMCFSLFGGNDEDLFGTRYRPRQGPVFVDLDQGLYRAKE
jgi:hypothetical protein